MSDMNNWSITGRLTKDATFNIVGSGKPLLTMDVAVNTGFGDSKQTIFTKVNMWSDRGSKIVDYLKKGTLVAVTGTLSLNTWTGKDGDQRQDIVLTTFNVDFYNTGGKHDTSEATSYTPSYKPRALEPTF